ncbi:hypothetical protein D3C84_1051440 [compost metagenome]
MRNLSLDGLHELLLGHFEDVAQVGDEVFVAALGLGCLVGNLGDRLAVAVGHFKHDVHRRHPRDVTGQVGADAEADVDPPAQGTEDLQ